MSAYNPDFHHRRSIRLTGYDYSQKGAYYVTICAYENNCIFGRILNGALHLNALGEIACNEWLKTPQIRSNVLLDEFIIMPNHIHGIIIIERTGLLHKPINQTNPAQRSGLLHKPNPYPNLQSPSQTLGSIIRGFKSATTSRISTINNNISQIWHRNYYEHIIRNEVALNRIREYIFSNPLNWEQDDYFINAEN